MSEISEQVLLSDQQHCIYFTSKEWFNVSHNLKFIGNAEEVSKNETLCGFICESVEGGFKDYSGKKKSAVSSLISFESLLKSLNIELNKSWNIYKQIK